MIKKLSSMMLMGLCAMLLTATMVSAEEGESKERAPVGTRSEPVEARMAQLESRAKMAAQNPEKNVEKKKTEKVKKSASAASAKKAAAKSLYHTLHPAAYQNPVAISFFGDTVELMDGSVWVIAPSEAHKTTHWYPTDLVVITPNHAWFSSYTFCLTNQNTGESVSANLHLGPIAPMFGSFYTHWIVGVDYYYNIVYLEDGSIWNMSSFDSNVVNQWIAGDVVIVGVNDGWLSSSKPNMLINVDMLTFAVGSVSL